jgi:hypothetical protein
MKDSTEYGNAIFAAWEELIVWVQEKRIVPHNEEEIQSFIYRALVNQLGTAHSVKPKQTIFRENLVRLKKAKMNSRSMHFPDLLVGENREHVVEIKFIRENRTNSSLPGCQRDLEKMQLHHPSCKRYLMIYEVSGNKTSLTDLQLSQLRSIDENCRVLFYQSTPEQVVAAKLSPQQRAIATMRKRGYDFRHRKYLASQVHGTPAV